MAGGGYALLPDGSVVVAVTLPDPQVRVLVRAVNRPRALTRLRNLGLRSVYLRGNVEPPTPDEISAVLYHPEGVVWRARLDDDTESWHPISALPRPRARAS
ncbi:hypothetical protein G5C51_35325 [Streptomyces sp. A7024]|uniref:Uncharacterized protein n=1 Tax=Streptomyces coryli TaxID=1128680 RepID=A0A6G4UCT6_9ACTN|nr:hypothetical protein [Streptomyces coryli]NGN69147.1 hypothetical protein [Streptomyces coryli]